MHRIISKTSNGEGDRKGRQKRIAVLALVGILVSSILIAGLLLFHPGRHTLHSPGQKDTIAISPSSQGGRYDILGKSTKALPANTADEEPPSSESSPTDRGGEGGLSG